MVIKLSELLVLLRVLSHANQSVLVQIPTHKWFTDKSATHIHLVSLTKKGVLLARTTRYPFGEPNPFAAMTYIMDAFDEYDLFSIPMFKALECYDPIAACILHSLQEFQLGGDHAAKKEFVDYLTA